MSNRNTESKFREVLSALLLMDGEQLERVEYSIKAGMSDAHYHDLWVRANMELEALKTKANVFERIATSDNVRQVLTCVQIESLEPYVNKPNQKHKWFSFDRPFYVTKRC